MELLWFFLSVFEMFVYTSFLRIEALHFRAPWKTLELTSELWNISFMRSRRGRTCGLTMSPSALWRSTTRCWGTLAAFASSWCFFFRVANKLCSSCSYFRDLLSKDGEKLDIKINPDGTGQLHVPGLRVIEVNSFQHIKKVSEFF